MDRSIACRRRPKFIPEAHRVDVCSKLKGLSPAHLFRVSRVRHRSRRHKFSRARPTRQAWAQTTWVAALSSQLLLWFRRHAAISCKLRHTLPAWDGHALCVHVRLKLQRNENSKNMQRGLRMRWQWRIRRKGVECDVFHAPGIPTCPGLQSSSNARAVQRKRPWWYARPQFGPRTPCSSPCCPALR